MSIAPECIGYISEACNLCDCQLKKQVGGQTKSTLVVRFDVNALSPIKVQANPQAPERAASEAYLRLSQSKNVSQSEETAMQ